MVYAENDEFYDYNVQKEIIWTTIALTATDQLRQRIAWALAQVVVVTSNGLLLSADKESEAFLAYYGACLDISRTCVFSSK